MKLLNHLRSINVAIITLGMIVPVCHVRAESAGEINRKATEALQQLYASSAAARNVGHHAKAVLVFPDIVKGGFIWEDNGRRRVDFSRSHIGHYRTTGASFTTSGGNPEI